MEGGAEVFFHKYCDTETQVSHNICQAGNTLLTVMSQKSDPPVLFVSYLWSSYSLIFNIFIWVAGYQSPTDGCKPVNNTFIPISGAEEFWQTLFRSISIFVR